MNKLFRFLVLILTIEILLGYFFYIKNSTLLSGHYISSTIYTINKVIKILKAPNLDVVENKKIEDKIDNESESQKKINKSEEESNLRRISAKAEEEASLKDSQIKCQEYLNSNQHIKFSGINALRRQLDMQTDLEFLNTFDEEKHYLVVLIGNSETFGVYQEFDKRLHIYFKNN